MRTQGAILSAVALLTGCGGGAGHLPGQIGTDEILASPNVTRSSGGIAIESTGAIRIADAGGVSFEARFDAETGGAVTTRLLPNTPDFQPPLTGSATMTGRYGYVTVDAQEAGRRWVGETGPGRTGDLELTADFANSRLTSSGQDIAVAGLIGRDGLSGTVTVDGISLDLQGVVGAQNAVGIFDGADQSRGRAIAGGFVVAQ